MGLEEVETKRALAPTNGRIPRDLRSEPYSERRGGGATARPWMWRRGRYCPSPRLLFVQGRRSRSSQIGQLGREGNRGKGRGRGWWH